MQRIAIAALPLVILPPLAILFVPGSTAIAIAGVMMLLALPLTLMKRDAIDGRHVRNLIAFAVLPFLLFCISYASTAQLSQWIDLFHRGESIGPASDYLRGKVPFRDVFALHGMLEDGLLDAWLMQLFGRSLEVAVMRRSSSAPSSASRSGSSASRSSARSRWRCSRPRWARGRPRKTTARSSRSRPSRCSGALRRNRLAAVLSGVFAGVAIFFSYEIGLYSIAGAFAASLILWIASHARQMERISRPQIAFFFAIALGAAPFVIYLAMRGALDDFLVTSFVTIPNIIDAVWSLPFPDLISTFRSDLNLHTLADFVLWEKFRFILSPLTSPSRDLDRIAAARRMDSLDFALLVLTVFATVTQRTALGRADFRIILRGVSDRTAALSCSCSSCGRCASLEERGQGRTAFVGSIAIASRSSPSCSGFPISSTRG